MSQPTKDYPRLAAYVAIVAALIGAVADVLLLYAPGADYFAGDYLFLLDISNERLMAGHFLGIFIIPLEMLGIWQVSRALSPAGKKLTYATGGLAVYLGFPGIVYHGTVAFTANFLKLGEQLPEASKHLVTDLFPYIKMLSDGMAVALPVGFFVLSGLLIYTILKRETHYKKWMVWCTPLTFYAICMISYLIIPSVGSVLLPAGFNLAFGLFFVCSLIAEKR